MIIYSDFGRTAAAALTGLRAGIYELLKFPVESVQSGSRPREGARW
jgi:hypothetical protein